MPLRYDVLRKSVTSQEVSEFPDGGISASSGYASDGGLPKAVRGAQPWASGIHPSRGLEIISGHPYGLKLLLE